jgi:hypothetical protein
MKLIFRITGTIPAGTEFEITRTPGVWAVAEGYRRLDASQRRPSREIR